MDRSEFDGRYEEYRRAAEDFLGGLFTGNTHYSDLYGSMRYSLLAGGKRIRPVITMEFARLGGLEWKKALPIACGLELMHTYSLIHDDLPCMDNDDLRRGKPTNHKVYGETMAVLAGDALQPEAFRLILSAPGIPADRRADCALLLAKAAGADGMVAGQVLDTLHEPRTAAELTEVHRLKTGAMLCAAAGMGCAAAGAPQKLRTAAENYAEQLGLAFQIRDDMLDVIGDEETFGKPIGSDRAEGKVTFMDLLGLEGCANAISVCTGRAKDAVNGVRGHEFLWFLAELLAERDR
jgi:geranylgeranyl diphosphate synthase type II